MKYVYRLGKIVPKDGYAGVTRGPYVISDEMPPTEQVDGRFYTSKAKFRQVGRRLGLVEVGNERFKPKQRSSLSPASKQARQQAIREAMQRWASR